MAGEDILVFQLVSRGDSKCDECGRELFKGNLLRKEGARGLCIDCADLGHLAYVPAGDACITRRASNYSPLRAIVLRFSRTRKRYERQGILVSEEALARAEEECLDDAEVRERRQEADAPRRAERDAEYVGKFADEIRKRYPKAPRMFRMKSPPMPVRCTRNALAVLRAQRILIRARSISQCRRTSGIAIRNTMR